MKKFLFENLIMKALIPSMVAVTMITAMPDTRVCTVNLAPYETNLTAINDTARAEIESELQEQAVSEAERRVEAANLN